MKLAISTLGCPDWDFDTVIARCKEYGIAGIEVRGVDGEMDADKIARFSAENALATKMQMTRAGLSFVGFGTSVSFHDVDAMQKNLQMGKTAISVCARMGIPAIRVFGNEIPKGQSLPQTTRQIVQGIEALCDYAAPYGIYVNLETHGDFNSIQTIGPIVQGLKHVENFGIVWDVEHTDKVCGDDFAPFYAIVKGKVRHIHFKDYLRGTNGNFTLCKTGEGDIPLRRIYDQLQADGYDGWYSLEWEKKWVPELEAPEVAFPHYVAFMRTLDEEA